MVVSRLQVHRVEGRRRGFAEARRLGGDRPPREGGGQQRRVRGHVRGREEAAGAGDGLQAVHQGDVRGGGVRAAVDEGRREEEGDRASRSGLRRRRCRSGGGSADTCFRHARVHRAGR